MLMHLLAGGQGLPQPTPGAQMAAAPSVDQMLAQKFAPFLPPLPPTLGENPAPGRTPPPGTAPNPGQVPSMKPRGRS